MIVFRLGEGIINWINYILIGMIWKDEVNLYVVVRLVMEEGRGMVGGFLNIRFFKSSFYFIVFKIYFIRFLFFWFLS